MSEVKRLVSLPCVTPNYDNLPVLMEFAHKLARRRPSIDAVLLNTQNIPGNCSTSEGLIHLKSVQLDVLDSDLESGDHTKLFRLYNQAVTREKFRKMQVYAHPMNTGQYMQKIGICTVCVTPSPILFASPRFVQEYLM